MIRLYFALLFFALSSIQMAYAYRAVPIYKGSGVVWAFTFLSSSELLLTIRSGELIHYNVATKKSTKLQGPNVDASGQGGPLDIYSNNSGVYLTYSINNTTALAKAKFENGTLTNLKEIFRANVVGDSSRHFGSRVIQKDNHLYITIGDRGERHEAQNLKIHNGKILRLNLDGSVPKGNPFVNEVWTLGHRNPQGIDLHPETGEIFSAEFGPRGGDEINLIKRGQNYGWPIITYGKEYWGPSIGPTHKEGMVQPIVQWTPSISPSAMHFYRGDKIPEWKNNIFSACLSGRQLRRVVLKDNKVIFQEKLFSDLNERIRDVRTGKDGLLYFSTDSGLIYKVLP